MRLWIWRGLRLEIPEDWEMLQFTKDAAAGRCAFADRRQFRLELNWRAVEGAPDFDRMVSDYAHKLLEERAVDKAERRDDGGWRGLEGRGPQGASSRYGRYLGEAGLLVELVLLWPSAVEPDLRRGILSSVAADIRDSGPFRRWRSFGLDLLADSGLTLAECEVQPALARMRFGNGREAGPHEWFERLGMVDEWLRTPVAAWLRHREPAGLEHARRWTVETAGHRVDLTAGRVARRFFPRPARRAADYLGAAWICPADGRLYAYGLAGSHGDAGPGPAVPPALRLRCCQTMEAAHGG